MTPTVERLMREIDEATAPKAMTQSEALDALEEIAAEVSGRIEALKVDIDNGPGE